MKDGKIEVAMVGLGAAGGTLTEQAVASGLTESVLVLNSSYEDLESLKLIPTENKVKLSEVGGAAKDRVKIYEQFRKNGNPQKFMDAFDARIMNSPREIVFVAASGAGGTGSGLVVIIARMIRQKYPNLKVIPLIIMPGMNERGIAQQNALDCTRELESAGFCMIRVDNSRIENNSIFEKYTEINKETIENLRRFINFDKISKFQNIDVADRLAMFGDSGMLMIGSSLVDPDEPSPMKAAVKRALETTPMTADIAGNIKRVAIQCEMDSVLYTEENRDDTSAIFKNAAGIFEGFYEPEELNGNITNRVLVVISGAHIAASEIRERESLVEQQFQEDKTKDIKIGEGNKAVKNAWTTASAGSTSEAAPADDYSNLFDEVDALRK